MCAKHVVKHPIASRNSDALSLPPTDTHAYAYAGAAAYPEDVTEIRE